MTEGSIRVVYSALAGNAAIAIAKLAAFAVSGSSAMLTEAIHSLVDMVDQLLLLIGDRRSRRAPDAKHPLGYGMEVYFWSFVVAMMVLLLGGLAALYQGVRHVLAALYQGVRHVLAPHPIAAPMISLVVLAVSAVFEASTFAVGFREYKRMVRGRAVPLWAFIRASKDPSLYASLLEDSAALVGIALAGLGIVGSSVFHIHWADGAASLAIGLLLTGVAAVLANETRSLIAGEAVAPPVMERLQTVLRADPRIIEIVEIATLHLGPRAILVALTLSFQPDMSVAGLGEAIGELTVAMQEADGRVAYVYVRPG